MAHIIIYQMGESKMLTDWNFWFSIITAIVAIIALFLSLRQIQLSNKQQLFERRLNAYIITNGLIELYIENKVFFEQKRENSPQLTINMEFVWLTNNSYMKQAANAIEHPLEKPYHQEFLTKREQLRTLAKEIELIFNGKEAINYAEFVSCYERTLVKMYQYQIVLNNIDKENEKHPMLTEAFRSSAVERKEREDLYSAMQELQEAYAVLLKEKVDEKIRRQISLK